MSKASILIELKKKIKKAKILDLYLFRCNEFINNPEDIITKVSQLLGASKNFIVRSSSLKEDQENSSSAGKYESVLNVKKKDLKDAIQKVIKSYGKECKPENEVFVQSMLENVTMSGVLFTHCPKSGAPYYIINYNESGDTTAVTSGKGDCRTQYIYHNLEKYDSPKFQKLISLSKELIEKLNNPSLDIEFAFNKNEELFLLQVRPLTSKHQPIQDINLKDALKDIGKKFRSLSFKHPYLFGDRTILGVMPDWNPAEIIGIKPKPLALSLYKELITDGIWAYQRDNYGYRNLRSFPLLVDLSGLPYIDTRVSFNSLLPKGLPEKLAKKLVNYYLDQLEKKPQLHDKIEFDITFSCYTFDLNEKLQALKKYFFTDSELIILNEALKNLTDNIIHKKKGLWLKDIQKISELKHRHETIFFHPDFDDLTKIYWLIEECKRYGTLPFAGLARAGFIAVQLLNSMVKIGVISEEDKLLFMNSLDSISTNMEKDFNTLDKENFIQKYGHLRPGTYNILSKRYDETPDIYFNWSDCKSSESIKKNEFKLSLPQMQKIEELLEKHGLGHDVVGLFSFMKSAIEGREYSKFIFTKTLSDILSLLNKYGMANNILSEDLAFLDIKDLIKTYSSSYNVLEDVKFSIERCKKKYAITEKIILPPIIAKSDQIESFDLLEEQPNFITKNKITSHVIKDIQGEINLKNAIVFIDSADPGYDWIFTRGIAGFVTAYGGINSHMSIRAAELNFPAIIGAGKALYDKWSNAKKIHIDCENQRVEVIA